MKDKRILTVRSVRVPGGRELQSIRQSRRGSKFIERSIVILGMGDEKSADRTAVKNALVSLAEDLNKS